MRTHYPGATPAASWWSRLQTSLLLVLFSSVLSACGGDAPATPAASALPPRLLAHSTVLAAPPAAPAATAAAAMPTLYTVGDSTVQTNTAASYPRAGWGQVLPHFFDKNKVTVVNKAVGGASARSYYNHYWSAVRALLKPGDFIMIGFGINDAAADPAWHTDPFTSFQAYLSAFVSEARARGAYPIIVATQPRNAWTVASPPMVAPVYHDYPVASRQLAARLGVPLIDLDWRATTLMQTVGQSYSTNFLFHYYLPGEWPNYPAGHADPLHYQETGALELANMVIAELRRQSGNAQAAQLISYTKPVARVTFTSNNAAGGLISRSAYFPAGATVTAYARPYAGYDFVSWNGAVNSSKPNLTFTMGTTPRMLTATFSGSPAVYQAEAALLSGTGMATASAAPGFHGSGYVRFPAGGGALAFNNSNGGKGGSRIVRIRYALAGTAARAGVLVINGASSAIRFAPGGSASNWATLDVAVTLNSGNSNAIALKSTGAGLADIDELTVR